MADCLVDIMTRTGASLDEAQEALDSMIKQRDLIGRDVEAARMAQSLEDYARSFADDAETKAQIVYREKLDNIIKTDAAEKEVMELGVLNNRPFLKSLKDWVYRIDNQIKEEQATLSGPYRLWKQENKTEWKLLETDRDAQREFIKARHELGAGKERPKNLNSTDSKIWDFAELTNKNEEFARLRANDYGAQIGKRKGYGGRHNHNDWKISRNLDGHLKSLSENLNIEATFPWLKSLTPEERSAAIPDLLREVQKHIKNGNDENFSAISPNDYMKGRQLSRRASAQLEKSRELIFKDTESWIKYNDEFGQEGVTGGLFDYTRSYGKAIPILRKLGTKPEAALASIIDKRSRMLQKADVADTAARKELDQLRKQDVSKAGFGLGGVWRTVSQQDKNPAHHLGASIASGARNITNMAKLGGAFLMQATDFPIAAMVYKTKMGMSYLDAVGAVLRSYFTRVPDDLKQEFGHIFSAFGEGYLANMGERIGGGTEIPGAISKATQFFFDASLMTAHTNNAKSAGVWAISRTLGGDATKSFDQLNEALRFTLKDAGLDKYWDVMREHMSFRRGDDTFIIPERARDLPDNIVDGFISDKITAAKESAKAGGYDVEPVLTKLRRTTKSDIEMEYGAFLAAMTDDIAPTPDARTRYWQTWGGLQAGTIGGEAARLTMQFKSFPIMTLIKHLMPMLVGRPGQALAGRLANTGLLLATMSTAGYLAIEAKRISKGHKPYFMMDEDEVDMAKVAGEAFMAGGGAGIWADLLFSDVNRYGGGLVETLAGPTLGTAGDAARLWGKGVTGELKLAEVFDTMVNNTPYVNMWYTRSLLNYGFLYGIKEGLSPGYLRQMENRSSSYGRPFILPPSQYAAQPF